MNGWRCPKCGSTTDVRVFAEGWAPILQTLDRKDGVNENDWDVGVVMKPEWDESSLADCTACGYEATSKTFQFSTPPAGTIPVINELPVS